MKVLKTSVLATVAVGALVLIGAGSAAATELTCTSPPGTVVMCPSGTTVHEAPIGHTTFDTPSGSVQCNLTFVGSTTSTGGASQTVFGDFTSVVFSNCTGPIVNLIKSGTFEYHGISGTHNALVTSKGQEITTEFIGTHCIYATNNTSLGTLTGSSSTGGTAILDISATIPRTGGRSGAFCGSSSPLTGSMEVTTPDWFDVDP